MSKRSKTTRPAPAAPQGEFVRDVLQALRDLPEGTERETRVEPGTAPLYYSAGVRARGADFAMLNQGGTFRLVLFRGTSTPRRIAEMAADAAFVEAAVPPDTAPELRAAGLAAYGATPEEVDMGGTFRFYLKRSPWTACRVDIALHRQGEVRLPLAPGQARSLYGANIRAKGAGFDEVDAGGEFLFFRTTAFKAHGVARPMADALAPMEAALKAALQA